MTWMKGYSIWINPKRGWIRYPGTGVHWISSDGHKGGKDVGYFEYEGGELE